MTYTIVHAGRSLNADRSSVLKSWDKSEIGMLRVVCNEMIHTVNTGDYRGLQTILSHVRGRTSVFSTIVEVVKAGCGKSIKIVDKSTGFVMSVAKETHRLSDEGFDHEIMTKITTARAKGDIGLFNSAFLASIGVESSKATKAFELSAAAKSFYAKAAKAGYDMAAINTALVTAQTEANQVTVEKEATLPKGRPVFDLSKVTPKAA